MIPRSHHIDAAAEQLIGYRRRDAKPGGRVLHIRDDDVDPLCSADIREVIGNDPAARVAEDVADKKQFHLVC